MKKVILIFALLLCSAKVYVAQTLSAIWSEKMQFENKKDGFFMDFIGKNSKFIYTKYDNLHMRLGKNTKKVKIVAFDKNTMDPAGQVTMIDTKKDPNASKQFKGLEFYKAVVFENLIYVFWMKDTKLKDELYVQTFDSKLKPIQKLKKIYEVNSSKEDGKKASAFVMANPKAGETILIGGELATTKGSNLQVEYKILKSDLSFASAGQVELPVKIVRNSSSLSSNYEYGDDGNLHIKTYIYMDKEERKSLKKGEASHYTLYSIVNVETAKIQTYSMKLENKNLFEFDYVATKDAIKLFGFFCDLTKDPKGNDTHGIFYAILDPKTMQLKGDMNFTYFTKAQLDQLFAKDKDKGDRNDGKDKRKRKKKGDADESLSSSYTIEQVQSIDKENIVLFCSIMYNYSVTTCDSKGNCTTRYYCDKSNVTAFKINGNGALVWASNLDRQITYGGSNIYDLRVINKDNKFIVAYGSNYAMNADKKNMRTSKSRKYKQDKFEYAVFDYTSGKFEKAEYKVNALNTPKKDKKTITALAIDVMDNEFYVNSTVKRIKVLPVVLGCLGGLVCPPVAFIPFLSGNSYKGSGYLGHIEVVK